MNLVDLYNKKRGVRVWYDGKRRFTGLVNSDIKSIESIQAYCLTIKFTDSKNMSKRDRDLILINSEQYINAESSHADVANFLQLLSENSIRYTIHWRIVKDVGLLSNIKNYFIVKKIRRILREVVMGMKYL